MPLLQIGDIVRGDVVTEGDYRLVNLDELVALMGTTQGPQLVILVGLPASGKSTVAAGLREHGYLCLSADAIREELFSNEAAQQNGAAVFRLLGQRVKDALAQKLKVVLDATNKTRRCRQPFLRIAAEAGCTDVTIIYLDVPLEMCLERNARRSRVVPDEAIERMFNRMQTSGLPQAEEGRLIVLRPGAEKDQYLVTQDRGGVVS